MERQTLFFRVWLVPVPHRAKQPTDEERRTWRVQKALLAHKDARDAAVQALPEADDVLGDTGSLIYEEFKNIRSQFEANIDVVIVHSDTTRPSARPKAGDGGGRRGSRSAGERPCEAGLPSARARSE